MYSIFDFLNTILPQQDKEVPDYIEQRLIGVIEIDDVTELFYFKAQNGGRYSISKTDSDSLCYHPAFFEKPWVECFVKTQNRISSYHSTKVAGMVVPNTIRPL